MPNLSLFPWRKVIRLVFFGLAIAGWGASPQAAEKTTSSAAVNLTLRIGIHTDFDRLIFEGPRGLDYEIHRDGTKVTIQFASPATINLSPVMKLTRAKRFTATGSNKPLAVSFTVAEGAIIKDLVNGSAVIVDIFGATETAKTEPNASGQTEPKNATTPAAATETTLASTATEKTGPALGPKAVPESEKAETKPETPAAETADTTKDNTDKKTAPSEKAASSLSTELGATPQLVASFDPKVKTGVAIFARGGICTILFDRKLTLTLAALTNGSIPAERLQTLELPQNTGYRFPVPPGVNVRASRNGTVWQIFLNKKHGEITVSTELISQPEYALGARQLLPVTDAPKPVKFTDPVVGDELIVAPLLDAFSVNTPRRMADYILMPAAQGLVIKPLHEKVVLQTVSDGIEITAEGGLKLSSAKDAGIRFSASKKAWAAASTKSMFDFAVWKGKPNENFTSNRQQLMQTIVDVPEIERNLARLELARFYFAHGMGREAMSLLDLLVQQAPDLVSHSEFLALRGAVRLLAGRTQDGLKDLSDPELIRQPEIELWRGIGAAQLRDWAAAEERFSFSESILNAYPEPFYSRFWVLAIEAALSVNKDQEAAEWLDRLEAQNYLPEIEPALRYLRGVLRSKAGHADMAESLWKSVAQANDRLYKIRAELALIDLGVATRSITPLQAVERLEGLRYAWRGDDLELDILHRLGSFYIEGKNYRPGLTVLAQAVRLFPDSPLTPGISAEMAKTFHDIFLGEEALVNMSPVEALTLYQDFQNIMPTGEEGIAVVRNLTERLVDVDLLDQAAQLLENQIKNLKGEEKVKTAARLAAIRLLDHKPEAAIAALDASKDDMPSSGASVADLQNERLLLRARAFSEQKKFDEALALLQDNTTAPAKLLRADITMRAQRWKDAALALLDMIGPPPKAGELVTKEQAQWLVNCAIAMSLDNDTAGLDKLAINFGPAMAGTPQSDSFRVLTRPEKTGELRDIAAAQSRITEVDMFRGFLDSYRAGGAKEKKTEKKKK